MQAAVMSLNNPNILKHSAFIEAFSFSIKLLSQQSSTRAKEAM